MHLSWLVWWSKGFFRMAGQRRQWEGARAAQKGWDTVVIIKLDKKREGRDGGQPGCYKRAKTLFWVEQWCVEAVALSHVHVWARVAVLSSVYVCARGYVSAWDDEFSTPVFKEPSVLLLLQSHFLSSFLSLFTYQPKVTLSLSLLFWTHTHTLSLSPGGTVSFCI